MHNSSEEKKLLIESMKKLVTHVSNNSQRQKEIFEALSLQDLNKIILNLKDDNEYLRRISALLLCQLFYQNELTKLSAVKLLSIYPQHGRVCLSGIPQSIHKYPSTLKKCIELMQTPSLTDQQGGSSICWLINLQRKTLKLEFLQYKKYSSFTFIDPLKNIFGFTLINQIPAEKNSRNLSYPLAQSNNINSSQYYKNYLESRSKQKQSKRYSFNSNNVNLSVDLGDSIEKRPGYVRPITSRQNANSYNSKKDQLNTSFDVKANTIQTISQYARNSYNNTKMNRSTFQPSSGTKAEQQRYQQSTFRQIQTDRRLQNEQRQGRKSLGTNNNPVGLNQDKLYKRVKQVLRK